MVQVNNALYTKGLENIILFDPALLMDNACDNLKIITGFTDCDRIKTHLIKLNDGAGLIYSKSTRIEIILGMYKGSSLTRKKHEDICRTINHFNKGKRVEQITCRYIFTGQEVHSKIYIWCKGNVPVIAFCGSANYTTNAFQKRRESMTECNAQEAFNYYRDLIEDTVDCLDEGNVIEKIKFSSKPTPEAEEIDDNNIENLNFEEFEKLKPVDELRISLLTRNNDVGFGSGVNWGFRRNGIPRDPDQAYIPYNRQYKKYGFFPDRENPNDVNCPIFKVVTREDSFYMRMAQDNNKALETPESNAILGKWIRDRLGVPSGTFVTKEMLEDYGSTMIVFKKYKVNEEFVYTMDFDK